MQGQLFTQDFLQQGITETAVWRELDDATVEAFSLRLREIFHSFPVAGNPNEATTERNLIDPILRALGWEHFLVQQATGRHRRDVPDYLLLSDAEALRQAGVQRQEAARYRYGTAILEAKRWQRILDRGREPDLFDDGVPSTQMLRYLSRAEVASERRIQWGILTNGRHWRLYFQGARSRSEQFLEIDLPVAAEVTGVGRDLFSPGDEAAAHHLKVFFLMFRPQAFAPAAVDRRTFHELVLDEGRLWEARVAENLSEVVFETVFPQLIQSIIAHDPEAPTPINTAYVEAARVAALTLLYRLLFLLYAEDRNLLPVRDQRYDDYALRRIREGIRDRVEARDTFSRTQSRYYRALTELFAAIHAGDEALGLPAYNGGLFDSSDCPTLNRATIPDAVVAPLLDALSRRLESGERRWINYRDLSVQQLGSIYERLLEFRAKIDDEGRVRIVPNIFARKASGSYYTHDDLVSLIIERTVGPLIRERWQAFHSRVLELRSSRQRRDDRIAELQRHDPASGYLRLKICDPATGSGHFLVSLVDYLADNVLQAMADAEAAVDWADPDHPYRSPLSTRIELIRQRILGHAETHGWAIDPEQLDDRHIVRRMILKRCVYGVDKNPMAVELAKVSLWLHTFTVGAPLSFLDHHLRCGDSLYGEWIGPAIGELSRRYGLLINPYVQQARNAVAGMQSIEEMTDADIAEVRTSAENFQHVTEDTEPLRRFLDFRQALRWQGYHNLENGDAPPEVLAIMDGSFGDPFSVIVGGSDYFGEETEPEEPTSERDLFTSPGRPTRATQRKERETRVAARKLLSIATETARRERFLHWQIAFPGVWQDWESNEIRGGFDAVIGNPPWDRMKLQEVEWFAARRREIALAARASDRKRMVRDLESSGDPLWRDYQTAQQVAEAATQVARQSPDYPLLSGGDVNIYSLFVERAHRLVKPTGLVGLLTPSGIASDRGASEFFRRISTGGRLAVLLDFENRGVFFPDVHRSFKFCVYVAGGIERTFEATDCAFFLHSVTELADPERLFRLSAADFAQVNPNTGTAPVFRTQRDADLTTAVYRHVPVLIDRRHTPPSSVWPVRYFTMFHMTNEASHFQTAEELERNGYYHVKDNRWRRGTEIYVPLYEGKMVQAYDHRAASVVVNPNNLNRPAQPSATLASQYARPEWSPSPQFWVLARQIDEKLFEDILDGEGKVDRRVRRAPNWMLAFKDVTSPTNVRTMIAAIVPAVAAGNTLPLLLPDAPRRPSSTASADDWEEYAEEIAKGLERYRRWAPLLAANLNSVALDYFARQKVHGQHLNFFIVEQLPVIEESRYGRRFGRLTAADLIVREVLRLTYTANDIQAFARDMGYQGPPFEWSPEDRHHRRARLDALYFLLYGLKRTDVEYVLEAFPIMRREDQRDFGRFLTRDLILAYMNSLTAGDTESVVSV